MAPLGVSRERALSASVADIRSKKEGRKVNATYALREEFTLVNVNCRQASCGSGREHGARKIIAPCLDEAASSSLLTSCRETSRRAKTLSTPISSSNEGGARTLQIRPGNLQLHRQRHPAVMIRFSRQKIDCNPFWAFDPIEILSNNKVGRAPRDPPSRQYTLQFLLFFSLCE